MELKVLSGLTVSHLGQEKFLDCNQIQDHVNLLPCHRSELAMIASNGEKTSLPSEHLEQDEQLKQ